jgi:hypothetical protein
MTRDEKEEVGITYQAIHVHKSKVGPGELFGKKDFVRCAVLVDIIDCSHGLEHTAPDLCDVGRLLRPILSSIETTLAGQSVLRGQLQWCNILQNKVSSPRIVETRELLIDTVNVVRNDFACDLTVVDEGVVAEIVGADPDRVHSRVYWDIQSLCAIGIHIFAVCEVCRYLIAIDIWEVSVDAGEGARSDAVAAHRSRHGVIIDMSARILGHVLRPWTTSIC